MPGAEKKGPVRWCRRQNDAQKFWVAYQNKDSRLVRFQCPFEGETLQGSFQLVSHQWKTVAFGRLSTGPEIRDLDPVVPGREKGGRGKL